MRSPQIDRTKNRLVILAVLLLPLILGAFRWNDENDYITRINRNLELFGQIYREVSQGYVDDVDPENLINAGIDGMLRTLDPYTTYMDRREGGDIEVLTSGTYCGIGITVGMRDSLVTVVDITDGYSAQREGVRVGDRILAVNGVDILHGPINALRPFTRGEPYTNVSVTIIRDGLPMPISFTLQRETIHVKSVGYSALIEDHIGYIQLERFGSEAGVEVRTAIDSLNWNGSMKGLILDLRNNPGGLLESAVDVISAFVPYGTIVVTTRGRNASELQSYSTDQSPVALGMPLVVLINEHSASASEIVAGAVQDFDAGVILGTPSFGKGLVQSVRRLPYDASLKITTARYYTPSGRSIQKINYRALRRIAGDTSVTIDTAHHTFRTRVGRLVGDHGGIHPDTLITLSRLDTALAWLESEFVVFNFATRYSALRRDIADGFVVDDQLLREFEEYALAQLDSLRGNSVHGRLTQLMDAARSQGYDKETITKLADVRSDIRTQQRRELIQHRKEVRGLLRREITSRFHGGLHRLVADLPDDRQIQTAITLLRSGTRDYAGLLSVR